MPERLKVIAATAAGCGIAVGSWVGISVAQSPGAPLAPSPLGADRVAQSCGQRPLVPSAADRTCVRAQLPGVVADLRRASEGSSFDPELVNQLFTRFNEGLIRTLGPNEDPAALSAKLLGPNAAGATVTVSRVGAATQERSAKPYQGDANDRRKRASQVIGTCTLANGVTRTSGNKPTAVASSQCTGAGAAGIAFSTIYTQLNRYSGGYYVVAAAGPASFPSGYAQIIAVDPRNTCGRYFANGNVRWTPKPGYTVNPSFTAGASREAVYC